MNWNQPHHWSWHFPYQFCSITIFTRMPRNNHHHKYLYLALLVLKQQNQLAEDLYLSTTEVNPTLHPLLYFVYDFASRMKDLLPLIMGLRGTRRAWWRRRKWSGLQRHSSSFSKPPKGVRLKYYVCEFKRFPTKQTWIYQLLAKRNKESQWFSYFNVFWKSPV